MATMSEQRIERLREIETVCYRICYHILGSEPPAHEAAKLTLQRLYRSERFFLADTAEQAVLLRQEAVTACVETHMEQKSGSALGA